MIYYTIRRKVVGQREWATVLSFTEEEGQEAWEFFCTMPLKLWELFDFGRGAEITTFEVRIV